MSGPGDIGGDVSGDEAAWRDLIARFDVPADRTGSAAPWPASEDLPDASVGSGEHDDGPAHQGGDAPDRGGGLAEHDSSQAQRSGGLGEHGRSQAEDGGIRPDHGRGPASTAAGRQRPCRNHSLTQIRPGGSTGPPIPQPASPSLPIAPG